jgi:FMN reductase
MRVFVVACSLNGDSRSALLAESASAALRTQGAEVDYVDLRQHPLPMCDGGATYSEPPVIDLQQRGELADAVLLAVPIYNYNVNAAVKNLVEFVGRSWAGKPVGFCCSAGGRGSFMSVMPLANSLMLDFRCLIVPRFVYAISEDFSDDQPNETIRQRIEALCGQLTQLALALATVTTLVR